MRRRVGRWTLRFAQGPGRQSGFLAFNALAVAMLPFTVLLRPDCSRDLFGCSSQWDAVLLVPRVLFLPAAAAAILLAGSWWAQHRHRRIEKRFFAQMEAARRDMPPGHFEATPLEQDLIRRTLRGLATAGFLAAVGIGALVMTPLAFRACDPWRMEQETGLPVCASSSQWTDLIIAFEVWALIGLLALAALMWYARSTSVRVEGLPKRPRRLRLGRLALRRAADTP